MSIEPYRRKDGLISYSIKFFFHGRCYRRSLGPVSLRDARLAERQARVKAANGTFDKPATRPPVPTLKAFAPIFLASYQTDARPRSVETYASRIDNHLEPWLGAQPLNAITAKHLDAYRRLRREEGAQPRTINAELAVLSGMFRLAVEHGLMPASDKPHLRWLKTEEKRIRVLSAAEEDKLLFAATPRLRPLIRFALQTGLRRNELTGLTWENINWSRNEVVVSGIVAKNRKRRAVPLNRAAITVLRALQGQPLRHGRLFGYRSTQSGFYKAARTAGMPGVGCHTLRHSFATRALERGVAIHTVQRWLGHADIKQTSRYLHLTEGYSREAIERLGEEPNHHRGLPSSS